MAMLDAVNDFDAFNSFSMSSGICCCVRVIESCGAIPVAVYILYIQTSSQVPTHRFYGGEQAGSNLYQSYPGECHVDLQDNVVCQKLAVWVHRLRNDVRVPAKAVDRSDLLMSFQMFATCENGRGQHNIKEVHQNEPATYRLSGGWAYSREFIILRTRTPVSPNGV